MAKKKQTTDVQVHTFDNGMSAKVWPTDAATFSIAGLTDTRVDRNHPVIGDVKHYLSEDDVTALLTALEEAP